MRRNLLVLFLLCVLVAPSYPKEKKRDFHGGIKLLPGFQIEKQEAIDAATWRIVSQDGKLKIDFEAGPNEGSAADPTRKQEYAWYKEQVVNGHLVRLALTSKATAPASSANTLLVTFPLQEPPNLLPDYTANFSVEIRSSEDLADALLMILTFDPHKF